MPRTIPTAIATMLDSELVTLATCIKLVRRDTTVYGFTTCDTVLTVDGVDYTPLEAISTSALRVTADNGVDNMSIVGVLSSSRITESDLRVGLFDNAAIELFMVDYTNTTAGKVVLMRGYLGEITIQDSQYTAELRSLMSLLKQKIGVVTSATCRVSRLGDDQCGVTIASYRVNSTVLSVSSDGYDITVDGTPFSAPQKVDTYYDYGIIMATSGASNTVEREIKSHVTTAGNLVLTLREPFALGIAAGVSVRVEAGCDRLPMTCVNKFSNYTRFHGEADIPGNDKLIQIGRGK